MNVIKEKALKNNMIVYITTIIVISNNICDKLWHVVRDLKKIKSILSNDLKSVPINFYQ